MAHHRKADVLMRASRALAEEITSFFCPARRWLAIFGVSVLLITFLLASPIVLGEYAQQILSQAFFFAIAAVTVDLLWGYTGRIFLYMVASPFYKLNSVSPAFLARSMQSDLRPHLGHAVRFNTSVGRCACK
jgi:hypothetical protein